MNIDDVVSLALTSPNWAIFQSRLEAYSKQCAADDQAIRDFEQFELHGAGGQD